MLDLNLNRTVVRKFTTVCPLMSLYIYNLKYDLSFLSNEVHKGNLEGKDDNSQTRVGQDLALPHDGLAPTNRVFDVPRREVNSKYMQLHANLQSML